MVDASTGTRKRPTTRRGGRAPDRPPRRWLPFLAAGTALGLTAGSLGAGAAIAAPTDRAESEAVFLSSSGALDLDSVAALAGAYGAFPPASESSSSLDLSLLSAIDIGLGLQLFGPNSIVALGATEQYQRSTAAEAYAATGLLAADGAIAVGDGSPGQNTTLNLTPVLGAVGADGLISELSVELGAVSASALATRAAGGVTTTGDYQIASGLVSANAPALTDLTAALDADLAAIGESVTALGATGGPIDTTVGGLLGGIDTVLETALGGLVDLEDPTVTTGLALDLSGVLDTATATPFVSGPLTVTLSTGEIVIDLDEVYDLNALAPGTELIDAATLNGEVTAALSDILTAQLPARVGTALTATLNGTAATIVIDTGVAVALPLLPPSVGDLTIRVDGTVGGLLGTPGSAAPVVTADGTLLGLPLGPLADPIVDVVVDSILPAVGDLIETVLSTDAVEDLVTTAATGTVTTLAPLVDVLQDVVSLTANVQETPGDFRDPRGFDDGSFTQRALVVAVAPALLGVELNLASATVRAVPLAVPADLTIDPARGPVTGGTTTTISGTGLDSVTAVDFGGVPADSFTINPDGTITAVTPPQAVAGVVAVTVTNVDGADDSLAFEYFDVTAVDAIAPPSGSTLGGDTVTITGTCLTGTTAVLFDGVAGTGLTVVSDTQLTVTTPAGTAGVVDVEIVNPTDCGGTVVDDGFVYVEPGAPTLATITPERGTELGGTVVTITGEDFTGTTAVTFDGIDATDFEVVSDTVIEATTPAHAPGVVDVVVTNEAGASAPLDFEYVDVAEIDDVTPGSGPEAGGNTVVITGDCFTGATGVTFGGIPATSFTVDGPTQITAVVPAGTAGAVDVVVVGTGDCGTAEIPDGYEYVAPPVVTDLEPASGPETGGTVVTIDGEGFTGTTGVSFGETAGTDLEVVSDTEIRVTTPPGAPGTVPVVISHPGGDVVAGDFEYLDVPAVTSIDPATGPEDGGTVVTIIGEGLLGATAVTFDGIAGTDLEVVSDTEIRVTTPAHAPALVDVVVVHPNGDSAPFDFTYVAGTEIDGVTPPGGPEEGGNTVVITGSCFTGATAVLFGGVPATSFTVDSDTRITAVVPAGTGVVDVEVVGAAACGSETLPDGYEYTDEPVIGTIAPDRGPETGGTVVTITGTNFTGTTSVTFDGVAGSALTVVSDTELRVTTPAHAAGDAAVVVTTPAGSSDAGAFTFYPVADIGGVAPGTGPISGGTVVTITGQCFTGATAVLFGEVPAQFEVINDGVIRAISPSAATTGTVPVTVVGAGECGTAVEPGAFTYAAGSAGSASGSSGNGSSSLAATGGDGDGAGALAMTALLLMLGGALMIARRRLA
ncbi:IPT/TIG domain-containing protein [Microbacterium plantarum]|uniref:IPT/TIG domain-containing protein n=1 Tax=Microbacterium plantarum TaxID=1816425 RepID=UPI002B46EAB4|nr:IPT/TIG domain-containing protein [Microbacterium plantarum]WRK16863.1 IPT/TIG domain-containing protein [Microbacterium plantarum]